MSSGTLQKTIVIIVSVMAWGHVSAHGIMGNFCEGTINAERYIQVLEQHLFQGHPAYFSRTGPNYILHMSQQHGFIVTECRY